LIVRKDATVDDISYVVANAWERGKTELEMLGLDAERAVSQFVDFTKKGGSWVGVVDDVPVAVTGIVTDDPTPFTWFQATDGFHENASRITRQLRLGVKAHQGDLYIYSVCVHPDTEKWFKVLGFVRDGWTGLTPAGFTLYRFVRR
jgi:hypothetical protein